VRTRSLITLSRSSITVAALLFTSECRYGPDTSPIDEQPLRVAPAALDFGTVYVGATKSLTVEVVNPNAVGLSVATASPPQFGAAPFEVGAGSDFPETVSFSPTEAGTFAGVLTLADAGVQVTGVGLAVPPCTPSDACRIANFDLDAGRCVETALADGTDCTASRACFAQAQCVDGTCLGSLTTCDDGDPCTVDVCGTTGCGHVEGLTSCPAPTDPCLAPSCDRDAGCGFVPVPDGTACGSRDCHTALVCIAATCVSRPVPQNQSCVEVVAGRPEGAGFTDGFGFDARFGRILRLVTDPAGNVWVTDWENDELRRISPAGEVTTVAGQRGMTRIVDGFGTAASLAGPWEPAIDPLGNIVFADLNRLRKATPAGLVVTWIGGRSFVVDGIGLDAGLDNPIGLTSGANGEFWMLDGHAGVSLRHVSAEGEVISQGPVPCGQGDFCDIAWTQGSIFVSSLDAGVYRRDPDGTYSKFWSGWGVRCIAASSEGHIALVRSPSTLILGLDAGQVAQLDSQDVNEIAAYGYRSWVVVVRNDDPILADGPRVVVLNEDGGTRILAGPDWPLSPQIPITYGVAASSAGDIFVLDDQGVEKVAGPNIVLWADPNETNYLDLAILAGDRLVVSDFAAPWLITAQNSGMPLALPTAGALDARGDLLATAFGGSLRLWWFSSDGGVQLVVDGGASSFGATDIALDDDSGVFFSSSHMVQHISADGTITDVAGGPNSDDLDGPGSAARFGRTTGLARAAGGDLYVADSLNFSVRRVTPANDVTTVVRLADQPTRLFVEDGGSVLVTVPGAVLRVHP
jgi:hypothetical protein